jgi:predicted nucleic acid-binding protein
LLQNAVREDRLWITPIVRMEILCSARTSSEYVELELDPDALRILRSDRAVADAAMSDPGGNRLVLVEQS